MLFLGSYHVRLLMGFTLNLNRPLSRTMLMRISLGLLQETGRVSFRYDTSVCTPFAWPAAVRSFLASARSCLKNLALGPKSFPSGSTYQPFQVSDGSAPSRKPSMGRPSFWNALTL